MSKKRKPVASVDSRGPMIMGVSDVIRWGDTMMVNGTHIDVAKAVDLGISYDMTLARKLKKDLKSKTGLVVTFPIARLMSDLQEKVGTGAKLLAMVKA